MVTLPTNHIIKSFFKHHFTSDSMPYHLLLDNITLKQRLKIKSSIVDINNHLIDILFNTMDQKVNNIKCVHLRKLSGTVYTRDENLQDWLRVVWTCGTTLASAYVLCHLSAAWLQLQIIGRSLGWE